jgi:hypothetical protein
MEQRRNEAQAGVISLDLYRRKTRGAPQVPIPESYENMAALNRLSDCLLEAAEILLALVKRQ